MDDAVTLPDGFTAHALAVDDIDDVIDLTNACELHDVGFPMWERDDLTSDLRLPGVEVERDTVGIRDGGRLVGWGFLPNERGAWVDVHPDARLAALTCEALDRAIGLKTGPSTGSACTRS